MLTFIPRNKQSVSSTDIMAAASPSDVSTPFPISKLAHRYLLYHAPTVALIRSHHNIPGVLIGSLPQHPSQNVFCGLPLELMPEEARLLVEKGVAYIVDDCAAHKRGFLEGGLSDEERRAFQAALRKQGTAAAKEAARRAAERKKVGLARKGEEAAVRDTEVWNDLPADMVRATKRATKPEATTSTANGEEETLFSSSGSVHSTTAQPAPIEPYTITPTTSYPPLTLTSTQPSLPEVSSATYPLYTHLHSLSYFLSPGLRFGCNYMVYPGDPLRFHAHFLCKGLEWEQEFDLLELVGGGRLGTGVKKGFLIGGREEEGRNGGVGRRRAGGRRMPDGDGEDGDDEGGGGVRTFCIEWAGM